MNTFMRETWHAFRSGLRGGVVPLIYIVLTGYLLIVLSRADYLNQMGAIDIPRNAPGLIYLMTSGDTFFLFFAWAWIFAQTIVRDRSAHLDEIALAMPVNLGALLAARYLGALGVALVVGSSQAAGFLSAPVLEWLGAIPPGSLAPPPWAALVWANLIFTLPLSAGSGALYMIAAIRTRSVAGPLAVAALLMTCWMLAMVVLKGNHSDPFWATIFDPSGFAEAEHQVVDQWTPQQKSTALLELTPALIWNRLLWGGLPLLVLAFVLWRVRRQELVLGREPAARRASVAVAVRPSDPVPSPLSPVTRIHPWRSALSEMGWQIQHVLRQRWLWWALPFLVLLAMVGGYTHVVQHAWGPLLPRLEVTMPVLKDLFYLICVFMLAGMVGVAARRDEQSGLGEMFDAAPMPPWVRVSGRAAAALTCALLLTMIPALGGIGIGLMLAPGGVNVLDALLYQGLALLPALLEVTALTLLVHALIRRAGMAYAASMLVAFILIVNNETGLVTYPPHQIGLGIDIKVSGLTGLGPWLGKLLISDGFKLALVMVLIALTVLVLPQGSDHGGRIRWRAFRQRLRGGAGLTLALGVAGLIGFGVILQQKFVIEGDFKPRAQMLAEDAAFEARWLAEATAIESSGGEVEFDLDPTGHHLSARWHLHGVRSTTGWLHAALPHGIHDISAEIDGQSQEIAEHADHLAVHLGACAHDGCELVLHWQISARGWSGEARPPWLTGYGYWLRPTDSMPWLGLDADRILRAPADRVRSGLPRVPALPAYATTLSSGAAAPAGEWHWRIRSSQGEHAGTTTGLLDFAHASSPALHETRSNGLTILHDHSRTDMAATIAEDMREMHACIARRLGGAPAVERIVQWPRGLDETVLAGPQLLLAEDPHWDIAEHGPGRQIRRADIAAAIARRQIRDRADLHDGPAAAWLDHGLPGALGLLCVAERDGLDALSTLLTRGADRINEALATVEEPVTRIDTATSDGWVKDYLPLAVLAWVSQQSPHSLNALFDNVRQQQDVTAALIEHLGSEQAEHWLGAPRAVDLHVSQHAITGDHWQWREGGWQPVPSATNVYQRHRPTDDHPGHNASDSRNSVSECRPRL